MKTIGHYWALVLASLLLAMPLVGLARAQDVASPPDVVEVRVEGNQQVPRTFILGQVRTRAGQPYSETVVREDQRRLLRTGKFNNVVVVEAPTEQGVIVTFAVDERPLVATLLIRGNRGIDTGKLLGAVGLAPGDPLDPTRIEAGRLAIEQAYHDKGYYFVQVRLDGEALQARNQVVYEVVEGPRVKVRSVEFVGNEAFGNLRLGRLTDTSRAIWPFTIGDLDEQQLAQDVVSLRNFYHEQGYLDADVARRVEFSPDREVAEVTFVIEEGPRYRVAEVRFADNAVFADDELRSRLSMVAGEHYTALGLRRDTQALQDTYGEIGHIEASVEPQVVYRGPDTPVPAWAEGEEAPALVVVRYDIVEGEPYRVGRITVRGNTITQDRVVRRQLQIRPEQLVNSVALRQSRQRLLESRLFQDVTLTPYGETPGVRNLLVEVEEGPTAEFIVGLGFSTDAGVLGTISFTQRNFDWMAWPDSLGDFFRGRALKGAGQTFRMILEPGTELVRARIDWREPYLFDRPLQLETGVYLFTRGRDSYDEGRYGGNVSLGKFFRNRWYGELSTRLENVQIDDLDSDAPPDVLDSEGDNFLAGLKGTLVRDRTDSRWLPSQGDRLSLSYEQIGGEDTFGKASLAYGRYWTLHMDALDRKHILAARTELDSIVGGGAPVYERYYGGGLGDIRGFRYRGISPRQGDEIPVGGDAHVYAGLEYSYPIYGENLRGVVFLDGGTVEEDWGLSDWRLSAGFGIRLIVPLFGPVPMSLDFGFPLAEEDEDENQLISFSFGWVF